MDDSRDATAHLAEHLRTDLQAAARQAEGPSFELLERYVDGRADEVERELVASHLVDDPELEAELGDLLALRDELARRPEHRRPAPLRWATLAAAAALAVVALWWSERPLGDSGQAARAAVRPVAPAISAVDFESGQAGQIVSSAAPDGTFESGSLAGWKSSS